MLNKLKRAALGAHTPHDKAMNVQSTPSNSQHHDTPNSKTHVIKFRVTAEEKASLELT